MLVRMDRGLRLPVINGLDLNRKRSPNKIRKASGVRRRKVA
jgi:hypothetical protein